MPEVSIILPNYNHNHFLTQRIESILEQTFQDFELIILDDASTDSSRELLSLYKDNIKVKALLFNETNSGSTFKQWEKGLQKAKGKFIWIAESDDLSKPNFLEHHLKILNSNINLGLSFSASTWIDKDNQIINEPQFENFLEKKGTDVLVEDFTKGNLIYNASSCVFKKSLIPWDIFDEIGQYKYCGDWLFWAHLTADSQLIRTPERLNLFRRHENNVSFDAEKNGLFFIEGLKVVKYIFDTQNISFIQKQKLLMYWTHKIKSSSLPDQESLLKLLPAQIWFYNIINPLFNIFKH
jgi:glycosyltransferase involved in cell wall biosynthesis